MTDNTQPEALRLAHIFDHPLPPEWPDMVAAAAELRRQHAELETLRAKLKTHEDLGDAGSDVQLLRMGYAAARLEIESLKAQLAERAKEHADELAVAYMRGASREKELAAQQGVVYAALPECSAFLLCNGSDVTARAWNVDQMRAFADATCALRATPAQFARGFEAAKAQFASHGQAPAQAAPAAVADCTRSHPHENMDNACRAKAAIAEMQSMAVRGAEATAQDLERFVSMLAAAPTTQPAPQQEAQEPTLYDPKALLEVFQNAQAGSSSPAGTLRGIAAVIASWESREPHTLIAASQPSPAAQGDALDAERLDWLLLRISGAEFRRIGVHYSGNARRADVDAARKQGGAT